MKLTLQLIRLSAASLLACSALAEETYTATTRHEETARQHLERTQRENRLNDAAKSSDIIGMTVRNYQGTTLGKVDDLAVDMESGRIVQVIVSIDGFIRMGETLIAVPPGALHHDVTQRVLHLDADKARLESAPTFDHAKWVEYSDAPHLMVIYRHYGEEPSFKFIEHGDVVVDGQAHTHLDPVLVTTRNTDGTLETRSMIPVSRLSHIQKASTLMGTAVKNLQEETLGKVDNILLDLPSGRIVAVVISTGGFLGIGDELSAVPPTALQYVAEHNTLQLDVSKELLASGPHFKADQWPDFRQPSYADQVYRNYRVVPYFTTNEVVNADNTALNARDRDGQTLTPLDQGNSQSDIDVTAQIRKDVLAVEDMSTNGKNVKIITVDGQVTLRGPVDSAEEKRVIGAIANRIAHTGNVDNQLEVVLITSSN